MKLTLRKQYIYLRVTEAAIYLNYINATDHLFGFAS